MNTPHLVIGHLRRREADLMTAQCVVTRPGVGDPVFDPDTGTYLTPPPVEVYTGACLVRAVEAAARVVQHGERAVSLRTYSVTLPAGSAPAAGDSLTVTVSADAGLVGEAMYVLDVPYDEWAVNRRILCEARL